MSRASRRGRPARSDASYSGANDMPPAARGKGSPGTLAEVYRKAQRHLARRDPVLKRLIAAVGPCRLQPDPDGFTALVRAVVAQLISTKAARSIFARLRATLG